MKISFCITAYDQDCYLLSNLLDMLVSQTASPDEIIIYISGISKLDLPKRIFINTKSVPIYAFYSLKRTMQSVARNICSKIASGDILIFFDVDDEPHPQKIEITQLLFNRQHAEFLLHNYIPSPIRNQPKFSTIDQNSIEARTDLIADNQSTNLICGNMPIHHAHIAVKRKVFDTVSFNEDPRFYRKEDGKFCQDLLLYNYKGIYCPETLVRYIIK